MVEVQDLVQPVIDAKPIDFDNAFAELMQARVADMVAAKKIEVAQNFFGDNPPEEPEGEEEPEGDETQPDGEEPGDGEEAT